MRSISKAFRRALADDRRDYTTKMYIKLANGGVISGNSESSGFVFFTVTTSTGPYVIWSFGLETFCDQISSLLGEVEERDYVFVYNGNDDWELVDDPSIKADDVGITILNRNFATGDSFTVSIVLQSLIWFGGLSIEDAVSNDNELQIGGAIINKATLVLNDIENDFKDYDFYDSIVTLYVGLDNLDNGRDESVLMGTYLTMEVDYDGSLIRLTCYDNMCKFDKPYKDSTTYYPASLGAIANEVASKCHVPFSGYHANFPNKTFIIPTAPEKDKVTCRQVLSWVAQIAGCFARCDVWGNLEIKWYDMSFLTPASGTDLDGGEFDDGTPIYATGDAADGGSFNPWDTGYAYDGGNFTSVVTYHVIPSAYSQQVDRQDIEISGVIVTYTTTSGGTETLESVTYGTTDKYVIVIKDNGLITADIAQSVANYLGSRFVGMKFRRAQITHQSDPSIEAGDVAYYYDYRGNTYKLIISSTNFSVGSAQTTRSSAQSIRENSAVIVPET